MLDDGRELPCDEDGSDFADAVAAAIRRLKRSGEQVLRVERSR
jgi:hypothetical protein